MSKILIILVVLFCRILINPEQQKIEGFTLVCQLKGLPDGTKIYLRTQGSGDTIARTISEGEHFRFTGKLLLDGRFHFISLDTLVSKVPIGVIFLQNAFISAKAVVGDEKSLVVKGSKGHDEYLAMLSELNLVKLDLAQLDLSIIKNQQEINKNGAVNSSVQLIATKEQLQQKKDSLNKLRNQISFNWIENHRSSLFTPSFIKTVKGFVLDDLGVLQAYNKLSHEAKASYYGVELKKQIEMDKLKASIHKGRTVPNFTVDDLDGEGKQILDIVAKSKYTLIDCWASWCKPCRAEVPGLKKTYAKYKDKGFNIIGISSDKDSLAWKKAVKDDQTTWSHFIEDKTKLLTKAFNLQAIPAYILVDGEGKMIAFDCAMSSIPSFGGSLRGEGLDKKLEELLGK